MLISGNRFFSRKGITKMTSPRKRRFSFLRSSPFAVAKNRAFLCVRLILLFGVTPLLVAPQQVKAQSWVLYGGTSDRFQTGGESQRGALVTIDQSTGATTYVGDPTVSGGLPGLAVDLSGKLFGVAKPTGHFDPRALIEIDPVTGG